MTVTLRAACVLLSAALTATGVCGCGGASPASSVALDSYVATSAAARNPVAVSPLPGTPDASPGTQISFLGGLGTRVFGVRVVGSRSGLHAGALRLYSTGTGESFVPAHPFQPGELVTVHARVGRGRAARAASTTFTVGRPAAVDQSQFPTVAGDPSAVQHYVSAPTLAPSAVRLTTAAQPGAAPGYLMMAPYQGAGSAGPMIVDQSGNLVWFHPLPRGEQATNLGVQLYQGRPVLAWWQGRIIQVGYGEGEDVLFDGSYRRIAAVRAGNGLQADLHEIRLSPQGTAWIDAFEPVHMNLSAVHGAANGILLDSVVQEIDVRTGLVMWEWHALGHIAPGDSKNPPQTYTYPWDFVHINSVDPGSAGDVLLSGRNTWALYDVDIRSGAVRWRLGGAQSSFKLGPGVRFYWQHDAEFQPGGSISLFDNGSTPPEEQQSRGLLLAPIVAARSVTLVRQLVNPARTLLAESQGNMLGLPGGNWLLGYGRLPNFTEFDSSGRVLLDGTLGHNVQNFKTTLSPWRGTPTTPPSVQVQPAQAGGVMVAVSWNGATDVAAWRVLAGASPGALSPAAMAAKTGFQTTIVAPVAGPYVAVQALDGSGAVIGVSPVAKV
jgi:hypothetical protein